MSTSHQGIIGSQLGDVKTKESHYFITDRGKKLSRKVVGIVNRSKNIPAQLVKKTWIMLSVSANSMIYKSRLNYEIILYLHDTLE